MNSTEDDGLRQAMSALFDQLVVPLARQMRHSGVQAFPATPDVSWLSYYVRRRRSCMSAADLAGASCADPDQLALRLAAHWQALGRHELAALAGAVAQAARTARLQQAGKSAEANLSPHVYAMF